MRELRLSDIAKRLGATVTADRIITSIETDSRKCTAGSLFVAIVGENADGNDYAAAAIKNGAEAAVVSRIVDGADRERLIVVEDTKRALIKIGGLVRDGFDIPFVGVTGSVGKTTTKEFIYAVLSSKWNTHKNEGNQNNEIGVPNTLFALKNEHEAAVIEMGMCNLGEIHDLSVEVKPAVGVITSVGVSHLEQLGTRENIRRAKLEITDGMADGSTLFICGDNDMLAEVKDSRLNIVRYGVTNPDCTIKAQDISEEDGSTRFVITSPWGVFDASIPTLGRHNVLDALAAFCVGCEMGIEPEKAAAALLDYLPSGMRQNIVQHGGITVVEDCYNCSPDSLRAAALTLAAYPAGKRRFLVVSDMLELGEESVSMHRECGAFIAKQEIDALFAFGRLSAETTDAAAEGGLERALWYETKEELADALRSAVRAGDVVWFKASRGQRLEEVIRAVFEEEEK